jgi:hypothetical protein
MNLELRIMNYEFFKKMNYRFKKNKKFKFQNYLNIPKKYFADKLLTSRCFFKYFFFYGVTPKVTQSNIFPERF